MLCFVFKRAARWVALVTTLGVFAGSLYIFLGGEMVSPFLGLRSYHFSSAMFLFSSFISFLVTSYSLKFMEESERVGEYYAYLLISIAATAGVLFASDFISLLLFWGVLGFTMYVLVGLAGPQASSAAKKTFIIIGGTDALMILGVGIVSTITRSLIIAPWHLPLDSSLNIVAFLSLAVGAFAKMGLMPFHSWVADSAEVAPLPAVAMLPAALDKLLGIYLLVRICLDVFRIVPNSAISNSLLFLGSFTIVAAVLGALVQHNFRKLLAFHAVSQVGYMVLGIGLASPLGVAGGIFHMLNNVLYKSCLFLCGGSVESRTGTSDLEKLGGLAKFMPFTFVAALIAALSISGVPPFNGFFSKWMIYQAIVEQSKTNPYWIIWLAAAMFGSAFTLASFVKFIHALFLGQETKGVVRIKEVSYLMWLPTIILSFVCVLFGIFAYRLPLRYFIFPTLGVTKSFGFWQPGLATALLLLGLLLGFLIYILSYQKETSSKPTYLGGEVIPEEKIKISGVDFYDSIKKWGPLEKIYSWAEQRLFDVYELGAKITFGFSAFLSWLHSGLLHTYLAWMFLGIIILWLYLFR
ncbi:MAG: NADH-quinone oxidoreductase subunit L [Candidatus Margulisiibacteriota bacterium]